MKSIISLPAGLVASLLLTCVPTITAHTWVEQLTVIASNGTFVGAPGYPRGFIPRVGSVDVDISYHLPPNGRSTGNAILPTDLMCRATQMIGSQTAGSPVLNASPGDHIALRYQENGHVTNPQLPQGKPLGGGIVYVYGTAKPSNSDTYLGIHHVWNVDGTGGDGRGVLLATRHYDDGQCYQIASNPEATLSPIRQKEFPHTDEQPMGRDIWCQTDIQLPSTVTGTYTLYWVWDWPTLDTSGAVFSNESYTTCMDVSVAPSTGQSSKAKAINFVQGQDLNRAAIAAQLTNAFLVNPTAAQQIDPAATAAPAANPKDVAAPPAPAPAPSPAQSSLPAFIPAPGNSVPPPSPTPNSGGFITVTVTASPSAETVYVTVTPTSSRGRKTVTVSPFSASKTTITRTAGGAPPPPRTSTPAAQPSSSAAPSAPKASPTLPVASGPPSVDPFLSPDSSTIAGSAQTTPAPRSSYPPAPIPTTSPFSNGTRSDTRYRIRGRSVRL